LSIVEQRVKPQRLALPEKNAMNIHAKQFWWQFRELRKQLIVAVESYESVLVRARISNIHSVVQVPSSWVMNEKTVVFVGCGFAVLQSCFHELWARKYSSTPRTDMQYTPTICFETFPFPSRDLGLSEIAGRYQKHRGHVMLSNGIGLTKTYNRFHDSEESGTDIQKLRQIHVEMDNAVSTAYGWNDLDLDHGFHETKQGIRYTTSEAARREVLLRLLKLNHERYAEEVKQGLHESKSKRPARDKAKPRVVAKKPLITAPTLFEMDSVDPAFPATDRERRLCGLLCDLVAAEPKLASDAYLDALVIALRPERHNRLLIDQDRTQFTVLAEKLFKTKGRTEASIPWADLLDYLIQNEAIRKTGPKALDRGSRFEARRSTFPSCDPKLVQLILKAAGTLRELQGLGEADPADSGEVLANHREDKRILGGATACAPQAP
jgi:hypothetical protein